MIMPHSHAPDGEENPRHMVSLECLNRWADRCQELEAINQELLEALVNMMKLPKEPLYECEADISSGPCSCGWHDAYNEARDAIARARGEAAP